MAIKDWGRFTAIYSNGAEWYLRIIGNCETQQYPHGLALATKAPHDEKHKIENFQVLVEEWLRDTFDVDTFQTEELEEELERRKREHEYYEDMSFLEEHCKPLFPE